MRLNHSSISFLAASTLSLGLGAIVGCGGAGDESTGESVGDSHPAAVEQVETASSPLSKCVSIRRGVLGGGADAQIASNPDRANKNYGAGLASIAGTVGPGQRQALVQFDLGAIPVGVTITSATMTLTARDDSHPAASPTNVHAVNNAWTESGLTWSSFYAGPSPQYDAAIAASSGGAAGTHTYDLTSLVGAWVGGAPNNGVLIEEGGFYYTNFFTNEDPSPANRPGLDVCYEIGTIYNTWPGVDFTKSVAFDGTDLWVGGINSIEKMRRSDGAILGVYPAGPNAEGIAFDGTNVWVANNGGGTVTKRKIADGSFVGTYAVGAAPYGIVFDGTNMWVTNSSSNTITKLKASDGSVVGTYATGTQPRMPTFDGTAIWIPNRAANTVTKLKASDGLLLGTFPSGGAGSSSVAFDGTNVWVTNSGSANVTRLDLNGNLLSTTTGVGNTVWSLAFDGVNMWASPRGDAFLSVMRVSDGAIVASYPTVGAGNWNLAWDGSSMWVSNSGINILQRY